MMKNVIYGICFSIITFIMWLSISLSYIEKHYDLNVIFSDLKKIISMFSCTISISILMTIISYIIVGEI